MSTASPRVPIALGSATSDTEEGRSFLQSRLKLFGGWVFLISGGFFIVGMPLRVAIEPVPFAAPFWVPSIFHLLGTFVPGGIWLVARGRSLSSAVLQVLDIGGVVLTCGCFSLMAVTLASRGRSTRCRQDCWPARWCCWRERSQSRAHHVVRCG